MSFNMRPNVLLAAVMLFAVSPSNMATLVGHDRVSAFYPGFHRVGGDATALAANGVTRPIPDGVGVQDEIVIRKVRRLSASDAHDFNLAAAITLAPKNPTMHQYNRSFKIVYKGVASVCGHKAFAFVTINRIMIPDVPDLKKLGIWNTMTVTYDEINTHIVALFDRDVWDAVYARLYYPGMEKTQAPELARFTSNYCVQPD